MAYTTIDDPSAHRHTQLYTGDGNATQAITNDANAGDFEPDWLWLKRRTAAEHHMLADSTRGAGKRIRSNTNDSEDNNGVTSFNTDGFTTLSSAVWNASSSYYVAWQWKANGGSRTTFTESGDNPGGGYQANTTAGFSIVDYTGTGSTGTVSHGLGAEPKVLMVKNRDATVDWGIYHRKASSAGNDSYLELNTTDAVATAGTVWSDTSPSSSVFTVGSNTRTNTDGQKYIAYCFAEIQGYSKFGSYTGTANADGPFVYTGFKPAWLMIRNIKAGEGWMLHDSTVDDNGRNDAGNVAGTAGNPRERRFQVNETQAEVGTTTAFDFLSNGFKLRTDTGSHNGNGDTIIYMAFAEHPFVSSKGVPVTAE